MTFLRLRLLLVIAVLVLALGSTVVGADGGSVTDSGTRLPATCREVARYLHEARGMRSLNEVRVMSGTQPKRMGAGFYRWRLADGLFDTMTIQMPEGEVISCWGRGR